MATPKTTVSRFRTQKNCQAGWGLTFTMLATTLFAHSLNTIWSFKRCFFFFITKSGRSLCVCPPLEARAMRTCRWPNYAPQYTLSVPLGILFSYSQNVRSWIRVEKIAPFLGSIMVMQHRYFCIRDCFCRFQNNPS